MGRSLPGGAKVVIQSSGLLNFVPSCDLTVVNEFTP